MSQKKTLYSFFKSCQIPSEELSKDSTIAGQGSHSPKNGPGAKKGTLVSSYTPSPLCSASSRLNQMPRLSTKTDESNKTLGKRKAELKRAEEGPKLKQPRLEAEIEDRRVKLLQGLGDGTAQEANLRWVHTTRESALTILINSIANCVLSVSWAALYLVPSHRVCRFVFEIRAKEEDERPENILLLVWWRLVASSWIVNLTLKAKRGWQFTFLKWWA